MTKSLPLLCFIFLSMSLYAQNASRLLLTVGYSSSEPMYNRQVDGGPSFEGNGTPSIGLRYLFATRTALTLETGVEYFLHRYTTKSNMPPDIYVSSKKDKVNLLSIPLYANLTFLKYFFFQCGPMLDIELNKKNAIQRQTGMGLGAGIGGKIQIQKLAIIINPFIQRHALLTFNKEQGTNMSLLNGAMRLGLAYSL